MITTNYDYELGEYDVYWGAVLIGHFDPRPRYRHLGFVSYSDTLPKDMTPDFLEQLLAVTKLPLPKDA